MWKRIKLSSLVEGSPLPPSPSSLLLSISLHYHPNRYEAAKATKTAEVNRAADGVRLAELTAAAALAAEAAVAAAADAAFRAASNAAAALAASAASAASAAAEGLAEAMVVDELPSAEQLLDEAVVNRYIEVMQEETVHDFRRHQKERAARHAEIQRAEAELAITEKAFRAAAAEKQCREEKSAYAAWIAAVLVCAVLRQQNPPHLSPLIPHPSTQTPPNRPLSPSTPSHPPSPSYHHAGESR